MNQLERRLAREQMRERLAEIGMIAFVVAWALFIGSAFAVGLWYYSTAIAAAREALGL